MVGESSQNVFLIQIDASSVAEFAISEFEISRFDCIYMYLILWTTFWSECKTTICLVLFKMLSLMEHILYFPGCNWYFPIICQTEYCMIFIDLQYWSLLNWQILRLHCGCVAVPVIRFFDIISSFFAKLKNVAHSLEPGETPSYSASHQAPNYVQRS